MNTAQTILSQLGGNKFIAMTGAKNFCTNGRDISFKVMRNASKVTHVNITLDPSDTYTVKFLKVRGCDIKTISEREGVYWDSLQSVFEQNTGLRTSL